VGVLISFVVPVRNDATRLETCLRSIQSAQPGADSLEIVVVDNASTDRSPEVARALGAQVVTVADARVSDLRNRGAARASGDVLAFVDADNEIVPDWGRAVLDNLRDPMVGATGSLYCAPINATWVQRAYDLLRGRTLLRADVGWLASGNLAVRRDVFQAVKGFDTSLDACEDVDLCHRIRAAGWRIVGDPRLTSVHHGDPGTLRDLFKSELWRGRDNLRVSFRNPIMWTAIPSAVLPMIDATLLGVGIGGLLAFLAGRSRGVYAIFAALFLFLCGALVKVMRAAGRARGTSSLNILQTLVAACVYDVARALALFTRTSHRNTRNKTAATTEA